MDIEYHSLERRPNAKPLLEGDWSQCSCDEPDCDQVFFQKSTIVKALQPFLEKYKDLPISVNFFSASYDYWIYGSACHFYSNWDYPQKRFGE